MSDEIWQKRLIIYSLVRLAGLAIFFFGLAVIYTDVLRPGGWPQVGAVIAILGVIDAILAPRLLRRSWKNQDPQG
jgi:membrane protein implicated in regulation of membrane protease activity